MGTMNSNFEQKTSAFEFVASSQPQQNKFDLFQMLNQSSSQKHDNANNFSSSEQSAPIGNQIETSMIQGGKVDAQSDEFEDLSESREIIEDKIFRMKLQMVDLSIFQ